MDHKTFSTAYVLSAIIAVLIAVASAGGLFIDGLYRDNLWITSQLRGSDFVRLAVVVPVFVVALIYAMRGSQRAQLIWLGGLWLSVYDYAFYLFGAAFNAFFLVYVALFSLSILALIFALPRVDAQKISQAFSTRTPVKAIGVYLAFIALFLGGLWTAQTVNFLVTGQLPQSLVASGVHTEIVFALDLSLVVPGMALGAVWLWRRQPWGYVLAALMLVKGTLYPLALLGMALFTARAGVPDAWSMAPFWGFFAAASLIASGFFFGTMQAGQSHPAPLPEDRAVRGASWNG